MTGTVCIYLLEAESLSVTTTICWPDKSPTTTPALGPHTGPHSHFEGTQNPMCPASCC